MVPVSVNGEAEGASLSLLAEGTGKVQRNRVAGHVHSYSPSIRAKILGSAVLLAVVPVVMVTWLGRAATSRALLDQAREFGAITCESFTSQIGATLASARKDLETLASLGPVHRMRSGPLEPREIDLLKESLGRFLASRNIARQIRVRDQRGSVLLRSVRSRSGTVRAVVASEPADESDLPESQLNMEAAPGRDSRMVNGRPFVCPIDGDDLTLSDGTTLLRYCLPLRAADGGLAAIIELDLARDQLVRSLREIRLGDEWTLTVRDERGRTVARKSPRDSESSLARDGTEDRLAATNEADETLFEALLRPDEGDARLAWSVELRLPTSRLLAPVMSLEETLAGLVAPITLAALLMGLIAAGRLTRPLMVLQNAAERIRAGDLTVRPEAESGDELGQLAETFGSMARTIESKERLLKASNLRLEARVATRTEALDAERARLDVILAEMGVGVAVLDRDRVITWANERLAAWSSCRPVGRSWSEVFCDRATSCSRCEVETFLAARPAPGSEIPVCSVGQLRFVMTTVEVRRPGDGELTVACQNLGERSTIIRRQAKLEQDLTRAKSLASLGEFAAGLTHEVGNPLGGIKLLAQAMERDPMTKQRHGESLDLLVSEIDRLSKLVHTFSSFAKPGENCHHNSQSVSVLVEETIALLHDRASRRQVRIRSALPSGLAPIDVDGQQIKQVLLNLLLNAIEAMPSGGDVAVVTASRGSAVEISITDTGPGLCTEEHSRIFEPFFTTKAEGTGLGLAVVRSMTERNGGTIRCGNSINSGATFVLTFPAARAVPSTAEPT